jgi:hypothetical protein
MTHGIRALVLLAFGVLAVVPAAADGETWRYPEKDVPATGPTLVEIGAPGRAGAPALVVSVTTGDTPVPGMAINVFPYVGKNEPTRIPAATAADGTLTLRGLDAKGLDAVRLAFTWEAGIKVIRVRLERKKGGWAVESAPYKRIEDGKDEGSCKNLFKLVPSGGGSYTLAFARPPSLAWCEVIAYGNEKKSHEYGRLNSIGNRNVNKGDKNMFSADDEKKMGLEASTEFDRKYRMVTDPQIVGYVTRIAEKVVAASDQPKTQVHVRVVLTEDVNAFVTAGGHVYVFTGLIKTAQNESQLAGVLAHEISHAIARHVTEGATRNSMAQGGAQIGSAVLGQLLGLGSDAQDLVTQGAATSAGLITLKYDRKSESEADLLGAQYLWNADWDPEAIARFFELFQKQGLTSSTPTWLSTHPSHEKRVENGIAWVRAFLPAKERYLVNTPEFEAVKAKVAKLPKPVPATAPPASR